MSKFKVLQCNQSLMAKLGIHSYRLNVPTNEFLKSPAFLILFILSVFSIASSAAFVYKNYCQFEAALQSIFVIIAGIQCGGMYLSVGLKMKEVKILQIELQNIVDEGIFHQTFQKLTHYDTLKMETT